MLDIRRSPLPMYSKPSGNLTKSLMSFVRVGGGHATILNTYTGRMFMPGTAAWQEATLSRANNASLVSRLGRDYLLNMPALLLKVD